MAITVRSYTTTANWNTESFFAMMSEAFTDLDYWADGSWDMGLAKFTGFGGTQIPSQGGREYIVDQGTSGIEGQFGSKFWLRRASNGVIDAVTCIKRGSGFKGHRWAVNATYSQTGNTVTVNLASHGIPVGRSVFIYFTSGGLIDNSIFNGGPNDGAYTVIAVGDENSFSITVGASGSTSGSCQVVGLAGIGNRPAGSTTVTVNAPNHDLVTGCVVYAEEWRAESINISATNNSLPEGSGYYTITVIDADTFRFTCNTSQAGVGKTFIRFVPSFRLPGSAIGGVNGTDDYFIRTDDTGGIENRVTSTWLQVDQTNNWVIWAKDTDPAKAFGQTFQKMAIFNSNGGIYFQTIDSILYNLNSRDFGTNTGISGPTRDIPSGIYNTHYFQIATGQVNALALTTYQSTLDPKFVIFSFTQGGVSYSSVVFHHFRPISTSPYTLDEYSHSSWTAIQNLGGGIRFYTPTTTSIPVFAIEHKYGATYPYSFAWSSIFDIGSGVDGGGVSLIQFDTYPTTTDFGPLINKLPINGSFFPSLYTLPDEFGLITASNIRFRRGDTITANNGEVYVIINHSDTNGYGMALVGRIL